jgi:hypothetical protein
MAKWMNGWIDGWTVHEDGLVIIVPRYGFSGIIEHMSELWVEVCFWL